MPTVLESIGTANPPYCKSQTDAAEFLMRIEGLPPSVRARIPAIHERSAIERRFTCIADYNRMRGDFEFYPNTPTMEPQPSTGARNALYREWAPRLAEEAARNALSESGRTAGDITHLIAVTCTGFYAPGLDVHLIKSLGLRPTTSRTLIGFMGCYAAFNGFKTARAICESDPSARVLMVCVELCTIHFQHSDTLEKAVVNALFADGAAAAVLTAASLQQAAGKIVVGEALSMLDDDSLGDMTWDIGDTGFLMGLTSRVPTVIAKLLPDFIANLVAKEGLKRKDIDFWAIHPGGRQIIDRAAEALGLCPASLADSYVVLREYGNMSSPTILFILKRLLANPANCEIRHGIALAFGPGLTIEGCLLHRS